MRVFFPVIVFSVVVLIIISRGAQIFPDPYTFSNEKRLLKLNELEFFDFAAIKFNHAKINQTYDIGLFGNSRILHISKEEINYENNKSIFNFALPGSSFRQTVAFIEELEKHNKAPKMIILSLDNFHSKLVTQVNFPNFLSRLIRAFNDISYLLKSKKYYLGIKSFHDFILSEWKNVNNTFETKIIYSRLSYWYPNIFSGLVDWKIPHSIDGSRNLKLNKKNEKNEVILRETMPFWIHLMEYDLKRLSSIASQDIKIVIYESPLNPKTIFKGSPQLIKNLRNERKQFYDICSKLIIICIKSPTFINEEIWYDASHPPTKELGIFLKSIITNN
ncbi:hypothetical protein OAK17_02195 [Alphaproteobacteria bacterium]|nr:hypothetical protein [Alphaproteobacteria bacterium]